MRVTIDPEGHEIDTIHELVDFSGQNVLEVGCGDGRMTWRYAERTASVLSVPTTGWRMPLVLVLMADPTWGVLQRSR